MPADLTAVPQTDPVHIYRHRDGLYGADLLTAAIVHLDLLSWLAENPSGRATLFQHFGFTERPADVLLTLLAANGLIENQGGVFHATSLAKEHLCSGSIWNLNPYFASLKDRPIVKDFLRILSSDKPASWGNEGATLDWHKAMETEAFAKSFTAAMDCRGHYLAQALAKKLDLSTSKTLLDIGGGSGIYACSLCAHHAHLKAVVFEQPPVDRITRQCIAERGFEDRVSVSAGNMFTDSLPQDCDVHLFSNVLHDWGVNEVKELLKLSFDALPKGGLLIIHDAFINATKTGPLPVAEYSAMLMHSTQGKCYSVSEYHGYLSEVGFEPGAYHDTAADRGMMTAIKL